MQIRLKLTREENARAHGVSVGSVVKLDLETYLMGVLPAEIYESRTPQEAKKAQAIAARTYALRAALDGTTLTDTPNHQAYSAEKAAHSPHCARAIADTAGMVLMHDGKVIRCYYSSSNGGRTKRTDEVWSTKLPYYKSRADPWDEGARRAAAAQGKTIKASHGVGLSQVGAEYAARLGEDCEAMLAFYYPGTEIAFYQREADTMGITGKQLAAFALQCYQNGVRYWYGTCYYKCTASLLVSKTKQYPKHYTAARKKGYQADIDAGAMCCDCVGLIKGAVWSELGTRTAKYGTGGCPDKSADGMLAYCKSKGMPSGSMDTFPDVPGLLLHKSGHVGVSIGDGLAIEARSYADDVVKTKVSGRGWTSWAQLPFIDYEDSDKTPEPIPYKLGERTLKRGRKGEDVAELQAALVALGYDCGSYGVGRDGIDGDFGYTTQAAVKAMQTDAGIEADGIYGPDSHAALKVMQAAGGKPTQPEGGSPDDNGSGDAEETPGTYTVTITGVDAATATYLLEAYAGATAREET